MARLPVLVSLAALSACVTRPTTLGAIDSDSQTGSAGDGTGAGGPMTETAPGSLSQSDSGIDTDADTDTDTDTGGPPTCEHEVGPRGAGRLTERQYEHTVRDLFGVTVDVDLADANQDLVPIGAGDGAYAGAAATAALAIDAVPGCTEAACDEVSVREFVELAFRGPAQPEEVGSITQAYELSEGDHQLKSRAVAQALLGHGRFYTIAQSGTPTDDPEVLELDARSLGTRLAYFATNTMPDDALLAAMEDGSIIDEAVFETHLSRLLATDRAVDAVADLYSALLDVRNIGIPPKDAAEWTPAHESAALTEQRRFVADIVFGPDPTLQAMLGSSHTFANDLLAEHYGDDATSSPAGPGFSRIDLDPTRRPAGVLTQTAFLTAHSGQDDWVAPSRRGTAMMAFLCQPAVPTDPVGVDPIGEINDRDDWINAVWEDPACVDCHQLIDSYGLVFDTYDVLGQWRPAGDPSTDAFADVTDMVAQLLQDDLPDCMVRRYYTAAVRRALDPRDECTLEHLSHGFEATGGDLLELMRSTALSPTFRLVRVP